MKKQPKPPEQIIYGVVKMSQKGQIIIPVDLRNELDIKAGDQLVVSKTKDGEGILLLKMKILNDALASTQYYHQ